jgi:hypothetical protein
LIIEFTPNTNPMNLAGASSNTTFPAGAFSQTIDAEFCMCGGCEYKEYAFHDSDGEEHKNDKTSFLVKRNNTMETYAFKLYKNGELKTTINSDALGEYYDFGDLVYTDMKGMVIYWSEVYDAYGNGNYTVNIEKTFAGTTTIKESHIYMVRDYSFDLAMETVKIESVQNGTFLLTGFTYRNLKWYQSLRVTGKLWNKQPKIEDVEYIDSNRQRNQIWTKIETSYKLQITLLPSFISNQIIYDQILGNDFWITDYNINNEVFRKMPLRISSIEDAKYYTKNTNGTFNLKFTDRSEGTIKSY